MSLLTVSKIQKESGSTNIDVPSTGQFIDLASAAQGDVLYYNGTSYVRLAPGTSGQHLQTAGAAANPIWGDAGGGKILQVVHTSVTAATFSTSSTSAVDITGMTLDITPAATSSKVLLTAVVNFDMSATTGFAGFTALRDGSAVDNGIGDAAGSRIRCAAWGSSYSNQATVGRTIMFLDSPSSTSAVTYKLQVDIDANTFYLNRSTTDTDNTSFGRTISTITAMEVGA